MPPQVLHFHDARIINPDVRDELLQAIYKLLQSAVCARPGKSMAPCISHAEDFVVASLDKHSIAPNGRSSLSAECLVQQVAGI
jgi:hypothetical protein